MGDVTSTYVEAVASVGEGTPVTVAAAAIVAKMTPEEKLWCLDGDLPFWAGLGDLGNGGYHKRPFPAARIERLGLPGFSFSDGPRGVVIGPATCFPVSMARGATWDLDLEERIGEAIGKELRAVGADLYGGVCVNVLRHPAWGRAQETYGEDPLHVGEFGAALVRGVQRHAMACVKHFACNSMENSRFKVNVTVDEVALHEVFLPQFRRVVDEGVAAVMSAYNSVNGEWCGENRSLLTDILRDEWGFEGFVISDWILGVRDAARSVRAGLDVEMPYRMVRAAGLPVALDHGAASWDDVDRSVIRTVATLLRFNHLLSSPRPDTSVLACREHRGLAREAAAKAVVLLRNELVDDVPLLPVEATSLGRVVVIGRLADIRNTGDGGSSDVWAPDVVTPLQGIRAALPGVEVDHDDGADITRAARLAGAADLVIVVAGYTKADEGEFIGGDNSSGPLSALLPGPDDPVLAAAFLDEIASNPGREPAEGVAADGPFSFSGGGDRSSLRLHEADEELIMAVADVNPRTVVAVVAGGPVIMSAWAARVAAIVQSWYSGMEGGHGLADVLLGRCNAEGRLPFTVPVSDENLPVFERETEAITYDRWHGWWKSRRDGCAPHFPFGFGLSYTRFAWGRFSVRVDSDTVDVEGTIVNQGRRRGAEIVQIYGAPASAGRITPRRLLAFARVEVEPGQSADVALSIPRARCSSRNPRTHRWDAAAGAYELEAGRWAGDPDAQALSIELSL
ncbi:MAG: beta-glucosidase family protein [Acidimicrobiales bacterium]